MWFRRCDVVSAADLARCGFGAGALGFGAGFGAAAGAGAGGCGPSLGQGFSTVGVDG